jgi:hypothetical protein
MSRDVARDPGDSGLPRSRASGQSPRPRPTGAGSTAEGWWRWAQQAWCSTVSTMPGRARACRRVEGVRRVKSGRVDRPIPLDEIGLVPERTRRECRHHERGHSVDRERIPTVPRCEPSHAAATPFVGRIGKTGPLAVRARVASAVSATERQGHSKGREGGQFPNGREGESGRRVERARGQTGRTAQLLLVLGRKGLDPLRMRSDRSCGQTGRLRRED